MIQSNLSKIQAEVAAVAAGREVKIIGASKTVSSERVLEAYDVGMRIFGENRIQEAIQKIKDLPDDIEWHFIGHLQSNKVRDAVRHFTCIQSVDSLRLLRLIDQEASKQKKQISILFEINLGGEETKHGLDPEKLKEVLDASGNLENVSIRGLMAIPPLFEDPEQVRPYFRRLKELASVHPGLSELSMGMSHDYIVAIEEGATMVRIGTALFGRRE
ncbi:YggS family pyridoxal phosphate-dependent enzyme [bacterium]|nr:YggS family pyridoxal phosphate-dependent enzyme [bacterium]